MKNDSVNSISKAIEYLLNQDIVIVYKNTFYLSKEEKLYCLDVFEDSDDDEGESYHCTYQEFFEYLKKFIKILGEFNFEENSSLEYNIDLIKSFVCCLVKFGFRVESKINLSIEKNDNNYLIEHLGYDFLPDEKKGLTKKSYENLAIACEKFVKIHNSFLESIKV